MMKGSQCFYTSYNAGPESLPVNNNNQDNFHNKYLYFNGLSTLPRKPRPKHIQHEPDRATEVESIISCEDEILIMKLSFTGLYLAKNYCL